MLFSLYVLFVSFLFPLLISKFHAIVVEKMLEIISVLLNLVSLILCPGVSSTLENVSCVLVKSVYSVFFGCSALKRYIKSNCSILSFRISVALLFSF